MSETRASFDLESVVDEAVGHVRTLRYGDGGALVPVPPADVPDGDGDEGAARMVDIVFSALVARGDMGRFAPFYDEVRSLPLRWTGGTVNPLTYQALTEDARYHRITLAWLFLATSREAEAARMAITQRIQELAEDRFGTVAPACIVTIPPDGAEAALTWFTFRDRE